MYQEFKRCRAKCEETNRPLDPAWDRTVQGGFQYFILHIKSMILALSPHDRAPLMTKAQDYNVKFKLTDPEGPFDRTNITIFSDPNIPRIATIAEVDAMLERYKAAGREPGVELTPQNLHEIATNGPATVAQLKRAPRVLSSALGLPKSEGNDGMTLTQFVHASLPSTMEEEDKTIFAYEYSNAWIDIIGTDNLTIVDWVLENYHFRSAYRERKVGTKKKSRPNDDDDDDDDDYMAPRTYNYEDVHDEREEALYKMAGKAVFKELAQLRKKNHRCKFHDYDEEGKRIYCKRVITKESFCDEHWEFVESQKL